jgi:uncharacterized paraquat-inducible protein A
MSTVDKPSHSEEEYFAREDALKKEKLARDLHRQLEQEHKDELKKLHHMRCPNCGMELHPIQYRGMEMARCFGCGGHFLYAGELEKLSEPEQGAVMSSVLNWFKPR